MFLLQISTKGFNLLLQSDKPFIKLGGNVLTLRSDDGLCRIKLRLDSIKLNCQDGKDGVVDEL